MTGLTVELKIKQNILLGVRTFLYFTDKNRRKPKQNTAVGIVIKHVFI